MINDENKTRRFFNGNFTRITFLWWIRFISIFSKSSEMRRRSSVIYLRSVRCTTLEPIKRSSCALTRGKLKLKFKENTHTFLKYEYYFKTILTFARYLKRINLNKTWNLFQKALHISKKCKRLEGLGSTKQCSLRLIQI